jgi:hypothetical protein
LSVSASGRVLYGTSTFEPTYNAMLRLVDANGVVELSSDVSDERELQPIAFNDQGHVLLNVGAQRISLRLAGPEVTARCPGLAAEAARKDGSGCQLVASGSTSGWPLVPIILFILARLAQQAIRGDSLTRSSASSLVPGAAQRKL